MTHFITKLSANGQIDIPEEIRQQLNLHPGHEFTVVAEKDSIILKTFTATHKELLEDLVKRAHAAALQCGLTEQDIQKAIADVAEDV